MRKCAVKSCMTSIPSGYHDPRTCRFHRRDGMSRMAAWVRRNRDRYNAYQRAYRAENAEAHNERRRLLRREGYLNGE